MSIREIIEEKEKKVINNCGTISVNTTGREREEKSDEIRTCFMVDRDRIVHSKSFRRLKHKTQVFIKPFGDHYRTRLTHTVEVSQIARTIGKGIGLNEDLIEAISLGHDIGHVAFAHNGEEVLNELLPNGFKHNINSIRVLTKIENQGKGLNLTKEVLDGVLNHSGFSSKKQRAFTLEGQVVKYSDKIAYVNHDIDDSIRAGILQEEELPKEYIEILGSKGGARIDSLVKDCIYNTIKNIEKGKIEVSLSGKFEDALLGLRSFMFKNIYNGSKLKIEREKAKFILEQVFFYFIKNERELPEFYKDIVKKEGLYQGVADYISGMSDDYCLLTFNEKYVPKLLVY
ncbi:deoxyguanosinetriphosphate triphosphohydrolase [Clostridium arbusti]|uniref:deoxyguanosinetriphosphate triphosphohydrolase n=1 Tax=Clostridium arbusti TaxID=1137848 RepID=UPI000288E08C|nr:deoxyguanosinetriphosphate triphosphohydrolase [Clostridium arbusti]